MSLLALAATGFASGLAWTVAITGLANDFVAAWACTTYSDLGSAYFVSFTAFYSGAFSVAIGATGLVTFDATTVVVLVFT